MIRVYAYAADPSFYNTTETVVELNGGIARRVGKETGTIPAADLDDRYNTINCRG